MPHDVFISYSSKDKPIADGVCATLEQNGLRCWIAPRDIVPGAEWSASIVQALAEARVFVLVLSQSANESNQIKREVERAVHNGVPIIPYRIEDVMPTDALEYFISTPHWLDAFTPPVERHAQSLAGAIKRLLGEAHAPPAPAVTPVPAPAPQAPSPSQPASGPGGLPMPTLVGAAAVGVLVLAAIGFIALRPHSPAATVAAQAGPQAFVGDWTVAQVSWAPSVSAGYAPVTLGELFAAVMNANRTTGAFTLNPSGGFQTIVEVDDSGTVAPVGQYLVFTSADGATAVVRPTRSAAGAAFGGQLGEAALVLQGNRRLPEPWVGVPDPRAAGGRLAGVAGSWRNGAWPTTPDGQAWTATMTIGPDGAYKLQLLQKVGGTFTSANGTWNVSVERPGGAVSQGGGAYSFNGPDHVTTTSAQGSTTYARKPQPGGAGS
jgi:hypothetical protein